MSKDRMFWQEQDKIYASLSENGSPCLKQRALHWPLAIRGKTLALGHAKRDVPAALGVDKLAFTNG